MSFEFIPRADSRQHQQLGVLNAPAERMTSLFARNSFGADAAGLVLGSARYRCAPSRHSTPMALDCSPFRCRHLLQQYFGHQNIRSDDQLFRTILLYLSNAIAHAGAPPAIGRQWCDVQSFRAMFDGIHMIDVFFQGSAE